MGNALAVTGLTGKKSGGAFAAKLHTHWDTVQTMFPGGVRALVRQSSDTTRIRRILPELMICSGSLEDEFFLRQALSGVDTLVHIAGIHLSRLLVRVAVDCGVRRLILVHTTGIYSKYKQAGEEYRKIDGEIQALCESSGTVLTILRPTMIYGDLSDNNVVRFIRMVDRLPFMPVVRGARYWLQPVWYEDLAEAYYRVLLREKETGGRNYDLSGGAPILLRDMLSEIGTQLGKSRVRFVSFPFLLAYAAAVTLYGLSLGKIDYREKVQRLCEDRAYPHDAAAADFGYHPVAFAEGVRSEIRDYLALGSAEHSDNP